MQTNKLLLKRRPIINNLATVNKKHESAIDEDDNHATCRQTSCDLYAVWNLANFERNGNGESWIIWKEERNYLQWVIVKVASERKVGPLLI